MEQNKISKLPITSVPAQLIEVLLSRAVTMLSDNECKELIKCVDSFTKCYMLDTKVGNITHDNNTDYAVYKFANFFVHLALLAINKKRDLTEDENNDLIKLENHMFKDLSIERIKEYCEFNKRRLDEDFTTIAKEKKITPIMKIVKPYGEA